MTQHSRERLLLDTATESWQRDHAYFRQGLARATGGNNAALLVIYCQADCWMSWNAAKRALSYGYSNVAWYPEGTDVAGGATCG